jgi:SEL1 protein
VVKKQWSISEWIKNFIQDDHPYYRDAEDENQVDAKDSPMPGGDADGMYEDGIDDGLVESLIIMGLAAALVFLIYYRQQHQLAQRQNQEAAGVPGQPAAEQQPAQPRDGGLFPQPGDPEFGQWVAGGVGH